MGLVLGIVSILVVGGIGVMYSLNIGGRWDWC